MKPPPIEHHLCSSKIVPSASSARSASVFGCTKGFVLVSNSRSLSRSKPSGRPANSKVLVATTPAKIKPAASGSTLSGASPASPSTTALSVACPRPVQASEPNRVTTTRAVRSRSPCAASASAKALAAFIGPTLCEDDGPSPILKSSNTPIRIVRLLGFGRAPRSLGEKTHGVVGEGAPDFDMKQRGLTPP